MKKRLHLMSRETARLTMDAAALTFAALARAKGGGTPAPPDPAPPDTVIVKK